MYKPRRMVSYVDVVYMILILLLVIGMVSCTLIDQRFPIIMIMLGKVTIIIRLLLLAITVGHFIYEGVTRKKILCFVFFMALVVMSYLSVKTWMLFDVLFIAIFWGDLLEYKKIINIFFYTYMFGTAVIVICHLLNLLPVYVFQRSNGRIRTTLSFRHPNSLGFMMLALSMLYILKRDNVIKWRDCFGLVLISIWTLVFPNSEAAALIIIMAVMIIFLWEIRKKFARKRVMPVKMMKVLAFLSFFLIVLLVYLITMRGVAREIIYNISSTLVSRFRDGAIAVTQYGFSSFGVQVELSGDLDQILSDSVSRYFVLDCLYINMPITKGLIPTAFFSSFYLFCINKCFNNRNMLLLLVFLLMMLYAVVETNVATLLCSFMYIGARCNYKEKIR